MFGGSESALLHIPSWVFATFVGVTLVLWWLLEELVRLRRQIKGARLELAKLRTEGVEIRNDGLEIKSSLAEFEPWERRALVWNDRVIASMRKISEADAEWFSVLDVVPEARVHFAPSRIVNSAHGKLLREHDFRVKRLGRMVYRLWKD